MGLTCGFVIAGGTDFLSTGSAWALFIEKTFSDSSAPVLLPKHQFRDKGAEAASVPFVQFEEDT